MFKTPVTATPIARATSYSGVHSERRCTGKTCFDAPAILSVVIFLKELSAGKTDAVKAATLLMVPDNFQAPGSSKTNVKQLARNGGRSSEIELLAMETSVSFTLASIKIYRYE